MPASHHLDRILSAASIVLAPDRPEFFSGTHSKERHMRGLEDAKVIVTGGSRGLGLGIVESLVRRKANVTVVARDEGRLAEVAARLPVVVTAGDVTDRDFAARLLASVRPDFVVLSAGKTPAMAPLHEHTWESFSGVWEHDVKSNFFWVQEALKLPLPKGSRVLL